MNTGETDVPAAHRRGRTSLVVGALLLTAVVAVGAVTWLSPTERSAAPRVTGGPGTASATSPASRPGELTSGPLMASSPPTRVSIPSLKVTAATVALGLQPDGAMQVPDSAADVGWYTRAPTPGSLGPAVLAGHVNWKGRRGSFHALGTLKAGAGITVERADGSTAMFTVTRVERHPKDSFPTDAVYGATDHAGLRLITCGGRFDEARESYRDNVIVYATLAHAHPA